MNPQKDTLYEELEKIHDLTDQRTVARIKEQVGMRNIYDEKNYPIFDLARAKGVTL